MSNLSRCTAMLLLLLAGCGQPAKQSSHPPALPVRISESPCPTSDRLSITALEGVDSTDACHLTGFVLSEIGRGAASQSGLMGEDSALVRSAWVEFRIGPDSGIRPPAGPSWVLELELATWPFSFEARVDASSGATVVMPWPDRMPSRRQPK